jgi:hypothetical protein
LSGRLEAKARKVARRASRGIETPTFAPVSGPASTDPFADIPESRRETLVEQRGSMMVTTYVDSVEGLAKRRPRPRKVKPEEAPVDPLKVRGGEPEGHPGGSEWARLDEADNPPTVSGTR